MKGTISGRKGGLPRIRTILFISAIVILNACVTTSKTTYLQEYETPAYSGEYTPPDIYLILPHDNLYINVTTVDPTLSEIFNSSSLSSNNADEATAYLISYPVKLDGTVDIPYIGPIHVAGKTVEEAKVVIESALSEYVNDASIDLKLVNNYVTILGNVNVPGTYVIYKENLNIFQALALAGDISVYGDRYKLSVVRKTMEASVVKDFDITDKSIIDSEYYYVMPNDVIYVKPMKGSFFAMDSFPFALILSSITTFILLSDYLQD